MDDWGGYGGLKPPSLTPSPGSKPLSALMWKNSTNPSLGPQTLLTAHLLHLCGARCYYDTPAFVQRMCACVFVCVIQKKLILHAACWSYVNRAVSHLLWLGWESSGGPCSLWVPDLHVIHSRLGGTRGEGGGVRVCPNPNSEKREGGRQEEKRSEGLVRLRVDWQLVP